MATTHEIDLPGGGRLDAYESGRPDAGAPTVVWHHGSPHTGALVPPLLDAAARRGVHLVTYARPGYGGSTPRPGRDVASAAADVTAVADALGVERFATVGSSGGGPHALACAALLGERVTAAASISGLAPRDADIDWYRGMRSPQALRSADEGREARAAYAETAAFDTEVFTPADWATLEGPWAALGEDAGSASAAGGPGLVDDDVAFVSPWGFAPEQVEAPVLLVHGQDDRMVPASHSAWLARHVPRVELRVRPGDGHVSVLAMLGDVLAWLGERSA